MKNTLLARMGFEDRELATIRSIGELVRQLRTTETDVVVCPDDRFAEVLRGQGFIFIKYPHPISGQGQLL